MIAASLNVHPTAGGIINLYCVQWPSSHICSKFASKGSFEAYKLNKSTKSLHDAFIDYARQRRDLTNGCSETRTVGAQSVLAL